MLQFIYWLNYIYYVYVSVAVIHDVQGDWGENKANPPPPHNL